MIQAIPARKGIYVLISHVPALIMKKLPIQFNQAFISLRKTHLMQIAYDISVSHTISMPGQITAQGEIAEPVDIEFLHPQRGAWDIRCNIVPGSHRNS